jgi:hypothetical protein
MAKSGIIFESGGILTPPASAILTSTCDLARAPCTDEIKDVSGCGLAVKPKFKTFYTPTSFVLGPAVIKTHDVHRILRHGEPSRTPKEGGQKWRRTARSDPYRSTKGVGPGRGPVPLKINTHWQGPGRGPVPLKINTHWQARRRSRSSGVTVAKSPAT